MATLKSIKNKYGLLTMQERFSLFQQARYENDQNEIDLIISESPQRNLIAPDFCELPETIYRQDTVNLLSRLNHYGTFEYFIDAVIKSRDIEESEIFSQAIRLSAYLYKLETDAWEIVCNELGLDANNFRDITAVICLPVKMMNMKDKFIKDCAFSVDEANNFLSELYKVSNASHVVLTLEDKIRFYHKNIE